MHRKRTSTILWMGIAATFLAALVAGCGGSGSSEKVSLTTDSTASSACGGKPTIGGNLVYARQLETVTVNPWEQENGNGDAFTTAMLDENLIRLNPQGGNELQPALAQSWKVSPDQKTYTFTLRPGIKFSDGTPITAADVQWSLDQFADPKVDTAWNSLAAGYKDSEVVNAHTVRINLTKPVAAFPYDLANNGAAIFPREEVEKEGAAFWKHPVGAGPFRLKEFATGNHLTLERNPYFWEAGKPYLDSVRFNFATEGNSRVLALKSGQAQMADGIPYSQITELQKEPDLAVQKVEVPNWIFLLLNNTVKPLGDLDVRTAMQYAINREEINSDIFKGVGSIPNGLFAPMKYWDKSIPAYEYNLAKAEEFMAKSKYPHGFSMTLQYPSGFEFYRQLTLLLQQELGAIGIKVKLEEESVTTTVENWLELKYDALFQGPSVSSDLPVPDEYSAWFANAGTELEGFFTGWEDPAITKKVETFIRTGSESGQAEQWPTLQREFKEQSPSINILNMPFVNAHDVDVCGTVANALGADQLQETWMAKGSAG
jgi:peptide/nickel transport system substrate-binding protein